MELLPTTNADGRDVVPMTPAQKYLFDLKGFILLPALLSEEELVLIRAHQHKFLYERESLPPDERDSPLWESYICPVGSAVIFTEALCHSGTRWTNEQRDRLTLFTCYDTVNSKWGKGCPAPEVVASFPEKRRTLFRGVWHGMSDVPGINKYYEAANQAV